MDKSNELQGNNDRQALRIWCCGNCEAVHFKAGNVLLNFTKNEFTELVYSVNDVFQDEFGSLEFYHLIGSLDQKDTILESKTIS